MTPQQRLDRIKLFRELIEREKNIVENGHSPLFSSPTFANEQIAQIWTTLYIMIEVLEDLDKGTIVKRPPIPPEVSFGDLFREVVRRMKNWRGG